MTFASQLKTADFGKPRTEENCPWLYNNTNKSAEYIEKEFGKEHTPVENPYDFPENKCPEGKKQVLHRLNGFAKPGQVMAVMGASGSGKTSFLNVLG